MKAISLWQPWATLIAIGAKEYETRSWATIYRGPLVIHAVKQQRWEGVEFVQNFWEYYPEVQQIAVNSVPSGAAVCVCDLVSVERTEGVIGRISRKECDFGDFSAGRFAWKLENVRRLDPPISARGAQGLWDWTLPLPPVQKM